MRRLFYLAMGGVLLLLLVSSLAFAGDMEGIKVGKGTLKVGGILQAGATLQMEDAQGNNQFTLNRARFLFWGNIVEDKVNYFVQTETKNGLGVLDYKLCLFLIPKTEIAFGRFLPNFTLYMPYSTAKLEMINYPLTTTEYAVWRQTGVQTTTKTRFFDFNLGAFNGGDQTNNMSDNNDAKDFLVRGAFKAPGEKVKLRAGGYAWLGAAEPTVANPDEKTWESTRYGGFVKADMPLWPQATLKLRSELVLASTEELAAGGTKVDDTCTRDSQTFFAHAGLQPMPQFEFLLRLDVHDPDTDADDDAYSWFTGGVNYYLEGINTMFYLNYIMKTEEGTDVDNDLVVFQAQVLF